MDDTSLPDASRPEENRARAESGPAGWPGATHFGAGDAPERERKGAEPRIEEVEAEPISRSKVGGPSIDVGATARAPGAGEAGGTVPPTGTAGGSATPPPGSPAAAPQPRRAGAVLAHLAYLIPGHIPGLVITLGIWVWKRRTNPFVNDQAREALNFQLCYAVVNFALGLSCCCLGFLTIPVWLIGAVLSIVAASEAGEGRSYRYPFIFRLIE